MSQKYANNAFSTLAATLGISDTTMFVSPGHGSRWPVIAGPDFCFSTLEDDAGNIEVVKVTAHTAGSDTFTIARAQQGSTARAWASGDLVEQRVTAEEVSRFERAALRDGDTYTGTHNFTGAAVTVATPTAPTHAATKDYCDQLSFTTALPDQTGQQKGSVLVTDGAGNAGWASPPIGSILHLAAFNAIF